MWFKGKEYLNLYNQNLEKEKQVEKLNENKKMEKEKENMTFYENSMIIKENALNRRNSQFKFQQDVKKTLLFECLYNLFNKSLGVQLESDVNDTIKRNLVINYIDESGVDRILNNFKGKSFILSEFYTAINSYYDNIITEAKKENNNNDNFTLELDVKKNFYDTMNTKDVDSLANTIKNRVTASLDKFIDENTKDQIELKETIQQAQQKIASTNNKPMQETYDLRARQKITDIRNNRKKNILESMVTSISNGVLKKPEGNVFCESGKLNMDKIVESATAMYTFLEMLNTAKIANINETYIDEVLENLK